MTVSIDPTEVRRNRASVKSPRAERRFRLPARAILLGGLGSAGLVAFTVGAFSFFSGLADPRVRSPNVMPAAARMPDLKDGIPALASESEPAAAPQAASFNLPRPSPVEPETVQPPPVEAAASAPPGPPPALRTVAIPPIQNASVIAETRTAALILPGKAETVKAKVGQPSAFVSLPPEPDAPRAPEPPRPAHKPAAAKAPPVQKAAAHRPEPAKPVADAARAPAQAAPSAASDDGDVLGVPIPGGRHIRAGIKAIGGLFGGESEGQ